MGAISAGLSGSCDTIQTETPTVGGDYLHGSGCRATTSSSGFTATAAADLDGDATHDGWYVNDAKQGLNGRGAQRCVELVRAQNLSSR
jgi:hypothetical protein